MIIGLKEEDYKDIFNFGKNNNECKTIYSLNTFSKSDYVIKFDEIYFEMNNHNFTNSFKAFLL